MKRLFKRIIVVLVPVLLLVCLVYVAVYLTSSDANADGPKVETVVQKETVVETVVQTVVEKETVVETVEVVVTATPDPEPVAVATGGEAPEAVAEASTEETASEEVTTEVSAREAGLARLEELQDAEVYVYTPGGESFGHVGYDVVPPTDAHEDGDCFRMWRATNEANTTWTHIFCNWMATTDDTDVFKMQWTHPMQMSVMGTGSLEFELWRDHSAIEQLTSRGQYKGIDPYDEANAAESEYGLGWFVTGWNSQICVNGECQPLQSTGVFQIGFPRDMQGHYDIEITTDDGMTVFWQGEVVDIQYTEAEMVGMEGPRKVTAENNWPIPEE